MKLQLMGMGCFRTILPTIFATIFTFQAEASVILNQGDVLISEFTDPDLRGVYNSYYFVVNNGPSVGNLSFTFAQDQLLSEGAQIHVELFEGSLEEEPVHSENIYGELSGLVRTESITNLWDDQQGAVRLTMLTGYVEFDTISAAHSQHRGQKYAGEIEFTAAPVPIPAAVWLFGSGLVGLVAMSRRKRRYD